MGQYVRWITAGLSIGLLVILDSNWAVAASQTRQPIPKEQEHEEALFVRRILAFWKDQEQTQVKKQILQFLKRYPESHYRDSLLVILGDTYWNEQAYDHALAIYQRIQSPKLQQRVFNNYVDSLYHLNQYSTLAAALQERIQQIPPNEPLNEEQQLWIYYYAEAQKHLAQQEKSRGRQAKRYSQALQQYEKLAIGSYAISAKLAQADILAAIDQPKEAARLYKELADYIPEQRGELLLQAGRLQAIYAPKEALLTFSSLQHLPGSNQSEAALYKAYLLFEQGNFEQLLQEEQALSQHLTIEQQQLLTFLVGRSHFALNHLEQATTLLAPLLTESTSNSSLLNRRTLLLTLIASAYQRNELPEVIAYSQEFTNTYPQDAAVPRLLYLKATAYKNSDHYAKAEKTLNQLLKNYPNFDKREAALFERNTLLYRQGRWIECRKAAGQFAAKYPDSLRTPMMLQYIPSATLKQLEEAMANGQETQALSEQLVNDINLVLHVPKAVPDEQKPKYLLKLGRSLLELQRYPEALAVADELLNKYPNDPNLYQAHLLAALCYRDGLQETPRFTYHIEKALELNPELKKSGNLRLNLFSAYLTLAKERKQQNKATDDLLLQTYVDHAADHLLQALNQSTDQKTSDTSNPLRQENKLWLANYLYNKTLSFLPNDYWLEPLQQEASLQAAQRARLALEKALDMEAKEAMPELTLETLELEQEYVKLAIVKRWLGDTEGAAALLSSLLAQQKQHPEWKWALKNLTLYANGLNLEALGQLEEAQATLQQLLKAKDAVLAQAAQLHLARVRMQRLPAHERTMESDQALAILKQLKELQIRKQLPSEPIHLEAALDYALFRASLESPEEREAYWLALLKQAKEDFIGQDDISSRDYHHARAQSPKKDAIYQSYLMLIDALIAQLEANQSAKRGDRDIAESQRELAETLYQQLLTQPPTSTRYLGREAQRGLEAMHSSLNIP